MWQVSAELICLLRNFPYTLSFGFGLFSVDSVVIGRFDEEVDLLVGSRHIMPYNLAADLVLDERVQLI